MGIGEEDDQFQLLEDKIDELIKHITSLEQKNKSIIENIRIQEGKIAELREETKNFQADKEKASQKVKSLLEKIEKLDI